MLTPLAITKLADLISTIQQVYPRHISLPAKVEIARLHRLLTVREYQELRKYMKGIETNEKR